MRTFQEIQLEIGQWAAEQFKDNKSQAEGKLHKDMVLDEICSFYGMVSELGELAALDVREMQGRNKINDLNKRVEAREDALADCLVFMCDYAARCGINLNEVLDKTWEKVRKRRQQTWEQDKAKEQPPVPGKIVHVRPDTTGNFGAGCEEGHHEFVHKVVCGVMVPACRLCGAVRD